MRIDKISDHWPLETAMRSENHPRPDTDIADPRSRARRREDGIIEIIGHRPWSGIGGRPRYANAAFRPPNALRSWWSSLASAMLSALGQIFDAFVEGFALYAIHMNPGLFWFSSENFESADPADDSAPVPPLAASIDPGEWHRSYPEPLPIQNNSTHENR